MVRWLKAEILTVRLRLASGLRRSHDSCVFFRYLLMYEIGGVYLDIKSTANKKLDDVLEENDAFILSHRSVNVDIVIEGG